MKESCYSLYYDLCSTRDSLKVGNSFHCLAGVSVNTIMMSKYTDYVLCMIL